MEDDVKKVKKVS